MQTSESESAVNSLPVSQEAMPERKGSYDAVRFNAMRHGILSRYTVLSHEDADEYQALISALVEEHQPTGATEAHLVEELAGVIWRKRRVLQAESACINQGLKGAARNAQGVITAAVPFELGMSGKGSDLRDLVGMTADEIAERQRDTRLELVATNKAAAILRLGGADAYGKAVRTLLPESRNWWQEHVENGEVEPTAEELAKFISEHLFPLCAVMEKEARHHEAIKAQAFGEGLHVHRLEKLTRYETHLDRKFERILAMLLKLKDLRKGR